MQSKQTLSSEQEDIIFLVIYFGILTVDSLSVENSLNNSVRTLFSILLLMNYTCGCRLLCEWYWYNSYSRQTYEPCFEGTVAWLRDKGKRECDKWKKKYVSTVSNSNILRKKTITFEKCNNNAYKTSRLRRSSAVFSDSEN